MLAEVSQELQDANQRLQDAEAELEHLNKEKRDMVNYKAGSYDFGPGEIFLPLAGR